MSILLIVLLLVIVFGGGYGSYHVGNRYRSGYGGGISIGFIVLALAAFYFFGGFAHLR